jgi:predicted CoA-binding protein
MGVLVMTEAEEMLKAAHTILLVDWPSRDVPDTLARAGYTVVVRGGPEPDNYSAYEVQNAEVVTHRVGHHPERADLVYSHRPLEELADIAAMARRIGAKAVWCQSGVGPDGVNDPKGCWVPEDKSRQARTIVESAGMAYIEHVYIADAVRRLAVER